MNIRDLLLDLSADPQRVIGILLPDGTRVPAHYHITEVGHITRRFIDCGGTRRTQETCLLQTWVHEDEEHRLFAGKLAEIFQRAGDVLPHYDLEVEVEHELDVLAQFTLESVSLRGDQLMLNLGSKHTDCLARGICLPNTCAPKESPLLNLPVPTSKGCSPGSGCC